MTSLKSFAPVAGMLAIVLLGLTASAQNIDSQGTSSSALPQLEGSGLSQPQSASEPTPTPASPLTADAGPSSPVTVAPTAPLPPSAAPARLADAGLSSDAKAETITERYPNGNVKIERQIIQDSAGNYVNHGTYTMYDLEGTVVRTGEFRNGKLHGKWTQTFAKDEGHLFTAGRECEFPAPYTSEAAFVDGQLHGVWTIKDRNGQNIVEWNFDNGARTGKWTWRYPNGERRLEATYQNGALNGDLLEFANDGKPLGQCTYSEGKLLEKAVGWYTPGQKHYEGYYLRAQNTPEPVYDWWKCTMTEGAKTTAGQDQKHGVWVSWYRNGNKQVEGQYDHGVLTGKFTWWYENGQKQAEGEYLAGKQSGLWIAWHPNGLKESQGEYQAGAQVSKWMHWDTDGKLTVTVDYNKQRPTTPTSTKTNRTTSRAPSGQYYRSR